jgi:epsin
MCLLPTKRCLLCPCCLLPQLLLPLMVSAVSNSEVLGGLITGFVLVTDDEFTDFQAAPTSAPTAGPAKPNLMEMLKSGPMSHASRPSMSATMTPTATPNSNLFGMLSPTTTQPSYTNQNQTSMFGGATSPPMRPSMPPTSPPTRTSSTPAMAPTMHAFSSGPAAKLKPSSNFDDLWSMSLGSSVTNKPAATGPGVNKSIKDLEKEKAQAGIWGSGQRSQQQRSGGVGMGGTGAFGNFGNGSFGGSGAASSSSTSAGGGDDLLL